MSDLLRAYLEHEHELKRYLGRFFVNSQDVEDIAQEAFIRAFATEIRTKVISPKKLLFTAAKHAALNELAKKSRKTTDSIADYEDTPVLVDEAQLTPEHIYDGKAKLLAFTQAVASLPPACRKVFVMRKIEGLQHKEIAARLHISVSAVEKHIATGTLKCSRYLKKIGYDLREFGRKDSDKLDTRSSKRGSIEGLKPHDR